MENLKSNNPIEAQEMFQQVLGETHISTVEAISVSLAALGSGMGTLQVIIGMHSCCGTTAYVLELDEVQDLIDSLTRSLEKVSMAKECQNAIRN